MADFPTVAADLSAKLSKAESKVKRYESALELALAERDELAIAMRVLAKHGYLEGAVAAAGDRVAGMNEAQALVYECTAFGEVSALAPKDVAAILHARGRDDLSSDYVRTTLWRLAQRGILKSENGLYWRPAPAAENGSAPDVETSRAVDSAGLADGSQGRATHLDPEGSIPSSSTPPKIIIVPDDDIDDDVPF
jgi:hypothetical protein